MLTLQAAVEKLHNAGHRSVAVVGLAKNVGKTTTLNALVHEFPRASTLALTSAGRDGEPVDMLTNLRKPRIAVQEGNLVGTAAEALKVSTSEFNVLRTLEAVTPMGPMIVARCEQGGRIELVGPPSAADLRRVLEALLAEGAELVLVDGALDRRAAAAPCVTDALVMATGAALSPDIDLVVERTNLAVELYRLSRAEELLPEGTPLPNRDGSPQGVAVLRGGEWHKLGLDSALGRIDEITEAARHAGAVFLGGALVTPMLDAFHQNDVHTVIVGDATRVFVDWPAYRRFKCSGGAIGVLRKTNLLAVTVNPWSPVGSGIDPQLLLRRIARAVAPVPVFDVVRGACCQV